MQTSNNLHVYIGWTKQDPSNRIYAMQTSSPFDINLVGWFYASSIKIEKVLHSIFSKTRERGEWFCLNNQQVKNILDKEWRTKEGII